MLTMKNPAMSQATSTPNRAVTNREITSSAMKSTQMAARRMAQRTNSRPLAEDAQLVCAASCASPSVVRA